MTKEMIILVSFELTSASENEYYITLNGGKYYHTVYFTIRGKT